MATQQQWHIGDRIVASTGSEPFHGQKGVIRQIVSQGGSGLPHYGVALDPPFPDHIWYFRKEELLPLPSAIPVSAVMSGIPSNVAGTRDFLPAEMAFREFIRGQWSQVSQGYGYQEYDAPLLEHAELYTRKGGDEILGDMYSFTSGGQLLALRPEMTPTVCRLVLAHLPSAVLPLKWFSRPQCWRNETVTAGRRKEFYQWNVDCFGLEGPGIEAECLAMIRDFCLAVGLTHQEVEIRVSDRRFLANHLAATGLQGREVEAAAFNIIDRLEKDGWDACRQRLLELGATVDGLERLAAVIGVVVPQSSGSTPLPPELAVLWERSKAYGLQEWIRFDPSIVRGLSYYTGLVFEVTPRKGVGTVRRALCGGGRYDKLINSYDPKHDLPAMGFGLGDVVVMELLTQLGRRPDLSTVERPADYCVVAFPEYMDLAIQVATHLRMAGERVLLYHQNPKKLAKAFAYADKQGVRWVLLLAPDEVKQGLLLVKDLRSDPQQPKQFQRKLADYGLILPETSGSSDSKGSGSVEESSLGAAPEQTQ